jgi:hypothetical protein
MTEPLHEDHLRYFARVLFQGARYQLDFTYQAYRYSANDHGKLIDQTIIGSLELGLASLYLEITGEAASPPCRALSITPGIDIFLDPSVKTTLTADNMAVLFLQAVKADMTGGQETAPPMEDSDCDALMEDLYVGMLEYDGFLLPKKIAEVTHEHHELNRGRRFTMFQLRSARYYAECKFIDTMIEKEKETEREEPGRDDIPPLADRIARWQSMHPRQKRVAEIENSVTRDCEKES